MNDIFVWKLISESDFKRLSSLYKGARKRELRSMGKDTTES